MLVVSYGKKSEFDKIETYRDYCPLHVGIHEFDLEQVRVANRLYGVAIGKGKASGFVGRSPLICGVRRSVDPVELATHSAESRWATRLSLDEELRRKPLGVPLETRVALLHEILLSLTVASVIPDPVRNRAALKPALIGAGLIGLLIAVAMDGVRGPIITAVFGVVFVVTLGAILVSQIWSTERYRSDVYGLGGPPIRRLALDEATLAAELKKAKKRGAKLHRRFKKMDLSYQRDQMIPQGGPGIL